MCAFKIALNPRGSKVLRANPTLGKATHCAPIRKICPFFQPSPGLALGNQTNPKNIMSLPPLVGMTRTHSHICARTHSHERIKIEFKLGGYPFTDYEGVYPIVNRKFEPFTATIHERGDRMCKSDRLEYPFLGGEAFPHNLMGF